MRTQTILSRAGVLALGAILGYAASSSQFTAGWPARAAAPDSQIAASPSPSSERGVPLAAADSRETPKRGQGETGKDGKKPNILSSSATTSASPTSAPTATA